MSSDAAADPLWRLEGPYRDLTPKLSVELAQPADPVLRLVSGPWHPGVPHVLDRTWAEAAGAVARAWFGAYRAASPDHPGLYALCYLVEGDVLALAPHAMDQVAGWLTRSFGGQAGAVAYGDGRALGDAAALSAAQALAVALIASDQPLGLDIVLEGAEAGTAAGERHLALATAARSAFGQIYLALAPLRDDAAAPPALWPTPQAVDAMARRAQLQVLDVLAVPGPDHGQAAWPALMAWLTALVAAWAGPPAPDHDLTFAMTLACHLEADTGQPAPLADLVDQLARLLLSNLVIDRSGHVGFAASGLFGTGAAMLPHTGHPAVAHLDQGAGQILATLPAAARAIARRQVARHWRDATCHGCPVARTCLLAGGVRLKQVLGRMAASADCPISVRPVLEAIAARRAQISRFPFAWVQQGVQGGVFATTTRGRPMRLTQGPLTWLEPGPAPIPAPTPNLTVVPSS